MSRLLLALGLNLGLLSSLMALNLTPAEQEFLAENPVIRLTYDPDFAPLEFRDAQGQYSGLARDYIRELEARLPVRFEVVHPTDWAQAASWMQTAEIDMYGMISRTPAREPYLQFTNPYIRIPSILITSASEPRSRLQQFMQDNAVVGVVRGHSLGQMAAADYPDLLLAEQDNLIDGLQQVAFGQLPAMMSQQATAAWAIQQQGITGLKAASDLGYTRDYSFGVRQDWPLLVNILNKAIADIDNQTSQEINNRWIALSGLESRYVRWLQLSLWALLGMLVLALLLFAWSRVLQSQVRAKTLALRQVNEGLEQQVQQRTQNLQQAYAQLKASQERLIQTEKMVSLGTMVAGLMHELNTPLGYMVGNLNQLQAEMKQQSDLQQDWLEMVEDSLHGAERIDQLIRSLKDYSRDHGELRTEVDLQQLLLKALPLLDNSLKTIRLIDKTAPQVWAKADGSEIQQVMMNLLQNAIHACQGVEQPRVIIVTGQDEHWSWFEVWDNGTGISQEVRRRIFDPFFIGCLPRLTHRRPCNCAPPRAYNWSLVISGCRS